MGTDRRTECSHEGSFGKPAAMEALLITSVSTDGFSRCTTIRRGSSPRPSLGRRPENLVMRQSLYLDWTMIGFCYSAVLPDEGRLTLGREFARSVIGKCGAVIV